MKDVNVRPNRWPKPYNNFRLKLYIHKRKYLYRLHNLQATNNTKRSHLNPQVFEHNNLTTDKATIYKGQRYPTKASEIIYTRMLIAQTFGSAQVGRELISHQR